MLDADQLSRQQGEVLLEVARETLEEAFELGRAPERDDSWLHEWAASFVTLTQNRRLRGCVGSVHACRPLVEDVRKNAVGAAFRDVRFPPLELEELARTQIEVSVLSALRRLEVSSEEELLEELRPGRDGLLVVYRHFTATFLPQVWEQLPTPRDFLRQLKRKAGLDADFWASGLGCWRYTVRMWTERDRG